MKQTRMAGAAEAAPARGDLPLQVVEVRLESTWTDDMDSLRRTCFPGDYDFGTSEDSFDARSSHLTIRISEKLSGYSRLTRGPGGVFETWTNGQARIPNGSDVMDISRIAISTSRRGIGLLRLVTVESLLAGIQMGFRHAVGAVIPDEPFAHVFYQAGLRAAGPVVDEIEPSGETVRVQPLIGELDDQLTTRCLLARERIRGRMAASGYELRLAT